MVDFSLSAEEEAIRATAREFARKEMMPVAAKYDQSMEYPWEVIKKAHDMGLLNLCIPEAAGGLGASHFMQALVIEELAAGCSAMTTAITANDLALGPLLIAGNKEQIAEFTGPMMGGTGGPGAGSDKPVMAAYCVTEPGAGSDVAGLRTTAKKDGDSYILNGEKMWITNASKASWYFVLTTSDPKLGHKGMIAFAIPANLPGIKPGKKEINMGQRCSDTRGITFDNVRVPAKYRLGADGEGFVIAMKAFDFSRPFVAALAVGIAQSAMDHAVRYALERKTFGKVIADHQAVAFMIADMAKDIEAARLLVWKSAVSLDRGERNTKVASMAKCLAGDMAVRVTQDAVQIFGGYGYSTEYPVEKLYRDAKICQIYEGTQQIQRMIISRHVIGEATKG